MTPMVPLNRANSKALNRGLRRHAVALAAFPLQPSADLLSPTPQTKDAVAEPSTASTKEAPASACLQTRV